MCVSLHTAFTHPHESRSRKAPCPANPSYAAPRYLGVKRRHFYFLLANGSSPGVKFVTLPPAINTGIQLSNSEIDGNNTTHRSNASLLGAPDCGIVIQGRISQQLPQAMCVGNEALRIIPDRHETPQLHYTQKSASPLDASRLVTTVLSCKYHRGLSTAQELQHSLQGSPLGSEERSATLEFLDIQLNDEGNQG
ncbi:hypothetical protein NDU88_002769 [Pleurodeles waltl]|uniref:Uncharacterized protein n=1 Tax=Pleurodeles waltl TaxID=8319 RepID=A0AAV7RBY9_PLEWA|nr:hypothetical protein NDU88_002769 [Pleurodeles waltl]